MTDVVFSFSRGKSEGIIRALKQDMGLSWVEKRFCLTHFFRQ